MYMYIDRPYIILPLLYYLIIKGVVGSEGPKSSRGKSLDGISYERNSPRRSGPDRRCLDSPGYPDGPYAAELLRTPETSAALLSTDTSQTTLDSVLPPLQL